MTRSRVADAPGDLVDRTLEGFGMRLEWAGTDPAVPERPGWRDPFSDIVIERLENGRRRLSGEGGALALLGGDAIGLLPAARRLSPLSREHLILDELLPRALDGRGALVLHAGAVRLGAGAVVVVAPSGRGKSTLSAALAAEGGVLLSDDAVVVEETAGGVTVRATYPGLRLLPDSLAALGGGAQTAALDDGSTKRRLMVGASAEPAPLSVLVALGDGRAGDPGVTPLPAREAVMAMVANSFALDPTDGRRAAARLSAFGRIAGRVRAVALDYPRRYDALPDVVAALGRLVAETGP